MKKNSYRAVSFMLLLSLIIFQFYGSIPITNASAQDTMENPICRLIPVDGEDEYDTISTAVDPGKSAVIVFGKTNCGITQGVVKSIAHSNWVSDEDISVIFVECNNASLEATKQFGQAYGCDDIILCYDLNGTTSLSAWNQYCDIGAEAGSSIGSFPTTVVINGNYVKKVFSGSISPDTLIAEIKGTDNPGGSENDPPAGDDDSASTVNITFEGTEKYAFAYEVADLVNQARAAEGLPALKLDESLLEVAMQRAAELSVYYSHTRPNGSTCFTASSRGTRKAENIAISYPTPQAVVNAWLNSEGHRANIMDAEMTSLGVGCFMDSNSALGWVQFFDNAEPSEIPAPPEKQTVRTVSVQKSNLQLQTDANKTFTASDINKELVMNIYTINREHASSKPQLLPSNFTFKSSIPSTAEVSDSGIITLKGVGTAVITASLKSDSSISVDLTIQIKGNTTVNPPIIAPPIPVNPAPIQTPLVSVTPTPEVTESPVPTAEPSPLVSLGPTLKPSETPAGTATPEPSETAPVTVTPEPSEITPGTATPEPASPTQAPDTPIPDTSGITPPNISKVKAVSGKNNVQLSWKEVPGAEGYILYQYDSNEKTWDEIASIESGKASYTVKKLQPGTGYRFAVKAYTGQEDNQVTSKSYTSIYTATNPQAVKFSSTAGKNKAVLNWSKTKGATGYIVYYKTTKNASWKKLKDTKKTSYTKKKLKQGKNYFFTVKAYKTYKGKKYISSGETQKVKTK